MYKVALNKKSEKFLDKIKNKEILVSLVKSLKNLSNNPYTGKKLKGFDSLYRIRVGKFRVIYKIDEEEKVVYVVLIDKRERVYKRV